MVLHRSTSRSDTIFIHVQSQPAREHFFFLPSPEQLPDAGFEVDMQDSWKVITLGAGRVPALPPAPAAILLVMTPETDSKCVCVSQKVGFGENTQTRVTTAWSCHKNLWFMASLREHRCTLFSLELVISYYQVKAKIIETRDIWRPDQDLWCRTRCDICAAGIWPSSMRKASNPLRYDWNINLFHAPNISLRIGEQKRCDTLSVSSCP